MKDEDMFLEVVRVWAATAWADGKISENEERLLVGLIRAANVGDATREKALAYVAAPIGLEDAPVERLGPRERQGLYRTACKLTTVDGDIAAPERALLQRLRGHLGVDDATAAEIERDYLKVGKVG
jgi:uncharacterized membrane protein YebE (DUF533 family)